MAELIGNVSTQETKSAEVSTNSDTSIFEYPKDAEKVNGRWAMLGLIALFGAYTSTGQIIPGIF